MDWYRDWQHAAHAQSFDARTGLDRRNLIRNLEGFNDVRLLKERCDQRRAFSLLEVGCATGEFSRYLQLCYPRVHYYGIDISDPAVARAKQKYPDRVFCVTDPSATLQEGLRRCSLPAHCEVVYAKDVMPHHTQPLAFLSELIAVASEAVIVRCRTRDHGKSELDPERSCQYHYNGWMPYLVLNLNELVEHVMKDVPRCEMVIYRNHMILGGQHNRFVPKELFLPETGTAETSVGVFKTTTHPGRMTIENRLDQNPRYTWDYLLKHAMRQALQVFSAPAAPPGRIEVSHHSQLSAASPRELAGFR